MKPVRIQRRRAKFYDMHAASRAVNGLSCISVTPPGRWGNRYDMRVFARELSMTLFRNTIDGEWDPIKKKRFAPPIDRVIYDRLPRFLACTNTRFRP